MAVCETKAPNQPRSVTLVLNLPPIECSPNWRGHWGRRSLAVKRYRFEAQMVALEARRLMAPGNGMSFDRAKLTASFFLHNTAGGVFYRPRDEDNARAALKAALDGIVDSGLIPGDAAKHVSWGAVVIHRGDKNKRRHVGVTPGRVDVVVEEVQMSP